MILKKALAASGCGSYQPETEMEDNVYLYFLHSKLCLEVVIE